jgi:hypothetical protein
VPEASDDDDGKLTVTLPRWTPLVGETLTHDTDGGAIDHLSDPFPLFEMSKVWDGKVVPALPCTLIVVGDTESVWANTDAGRMSAAATTVNNRTTKGRVSIGTPGTRYRCQ